MNVAASRFAWLALLLGAGVAVSAQADTTAATPLANLDYSYSASWGGMGVGQIEVSLRQEGAAGCYKYTNTSNPSALVRALYGSPNQTSLFCLKDGHIRSQHFESVLQGDDKQSYKLDFDWSKHTVTDENGQVRTIPDDAVDSFALQQAVRLWIHRRIHHGRQQEPDPLPVQVQRPPENRYACRQFRHPADGAHRQPRQAGPFLAGAGSRLHAGEDRDQERRQADGVDGADEVAMLRRRPCAAGNPPPFP
jgi:hypothetical protein